MYKLVIVDDEPHILEGLQNLYPWDNLGFHVVATFVNGKEALDYIYKFFGVTSSQESA